MILGKDTAHGLIPSLVAAKRVENASDVLHHKVDAALARHKARQNLALRIGILFGHDDGADLLRSEATRGQRQYDGGIDATADSHHGAPPSQVLSDGLHQR